VFDILTSKWDDLTIIERGLVLTVVVVVTTIIVNFIV